MQLRQGDRQCNTFGESDDDFEQDIETIKLDSLFPPETKAQNLKIDVQGKMSYMSCVVRNVF
jgi:hypothetical protein